MSIQVSDTNAPNRIIYFQSPAVIGNFYQSFDEPMQMGNSLQVIVAATTMGAFTIWGTILT